MRDKVRYNSLNGLRAISCIGILMMHILANGHYKLNSIVTSLIDSFTHFVYLFMIISSFSMCCGYYEKIKENKITLEDFYTKRIKKIMPFFLFLIVIDIIYNHNISTLIEGFANATMMYSFLPKTLNVIGVGWFLGLIFIFYMIFPFFVYLFSNKKRAWFVTIASLLMNITGTLYFNIGRTNMFYSFIYFCIGALIYLYREKIINFLKIKKILNIIIFMIFLLMYYLLPINKNTFDIMMILIFTTLTCFSISNEYKLLNNKVVNYISNISLEIYLSHMLIFRILEKINIIKLFGNTYISFLITSIICLLGTIVLAEIFETIQNKIRTIIKGVK